MTVRPLMAAYTARREAASENGQNQITRHSIQPRGNDEQVDLKFLKHLDELTKDRREQWTPMILGNRRSGPWSSIKFPPLGKQPSFPPENTIRYISDSILSEAQANDLCRKFNLKVGEHVSKFPSQDCRIISRHILKGVESFIHIYFTCREQAAEFAEIMMIQCKWHSKKDSIKLQQQRVGICHAQDLMTFHFSPMSMRKRDASTVQQNEYLEAISNFLFHHAELRPIGIWSQSYTLKGVSEVLKDNIVKLVVRRPLDFDIERLPGFWRRNLASDLKYNPSDVNPGKEHAAADDSDDEREHPVWFFINYGPRQRYCRVCKFNIHDWQTCPAVLCHNCYELGHVKEVCTNETLPKYKCWNCKERGHIAQDCPEEIVEEFSGEEDYH